LTYATEQYNSINYQLDLTTNGASIVYDYTITSSPSTHLVGKTTRGVTYYGAGNGTVGIYVQGAYIYGDNSGTDINYFGLTDISKRSSLLASLVAFAVSRDVDTIVKPQPLANIRLDGVGKWFLSTYLNASLSNFDSILDMYNITPSIGFIDYLDFKPDYWQIVASEVLSQLKEKYRDWEQTTNLRYYTDPRPMTKEQIEALIDNIRGNYSQLKMDLFSTVVAPRGLWNQSTLDAMVSKNLYLIAILDSYYSDWWHLRVNSSVIVHSGFQILPELIGTDSAENFTQSGLDKHSIHYKYFSRRDKWALSVVNGFPSFVYYVPNFRWNEVGTYSLRTVWKNLTSEIPDIRFVPLMEAGLYFGNKWMRIKNVNRVGSVIEFDVDASAIPSDVAGIEKGMLWLRINANESIQEVSIDNDPWFYFDEDSIRMPAPMNLSHVKVTFGALSSPRVDTARHKVVEARYDGYRLKVSISCPEDLKISVSLFLPQVGPFMTGNWSLSSPEARWRYKFDDQSRLLELWAISDGFFTFEVGIFFMIEQTPPWYNSSVTITVNITDLQIDVQKVVLGYAISDEWFNITMKIEDGLYLAEIPMMPYGTFVEYKVSVLDMVGHWVVTDFLSYNVIDRIPPEVGVPTWSPQSPDNDEPVTVNIFVTEPENGSGVNNVVLRHYRDDIGGVLYAKRINMTEENDVWSADIPGQSGGAFVKFFVEAYDKAGNIGQTSHYSYRVGGVSALPFLIVLLGIGLAVGIGVILYFVKFKKSSITHKTLREKNASKTRSKQLTDS